MASDVNPSGNQKSAREFPIQSLRDFLVPDALLKVKLFEANSLVELASLVDGWILESKAIVATVSPALKTIVSGSLGQTPSYTLSLTYLPAVEQ
jgi:hypothetical protein